MVKKGQINIGYKGRRIAYSGSEKLVGQAERYSTIDYQSIIAYAAKAAAVPESSIEMAMEALFDAMNYFVLNGHSVQIPNLGTFSIGVRAKSAADESEFTANFSQNLRNVIIRFLPDTDLKQMIANTGISTSVDTEDYTANGAITVRSMNFARGSQMIGLYAGRAYAVPDPCETLVVNGTRLSKDFIGSVPIVLTGFDANGDTVVMGSPAGALISLKYGQIRVNIKKFLDFHPEVVALKTVKVEDAEHNIIVERSFAALAEGPQISAVSVDDVPVAPGGTVKFETGVAKKIRIWGYNLTDATEVKIGNTVVTPSAVNAAYLTVNFTPSVSGNYPVSVKDDTHAASTYNMSFGEAANVIVSSVTANGDALVNGGNTNITAGSNYAIQIAGTGLTNLTAADFVLPTGSTLAITSQSNTLIAATISNAQEGVGWQLHLHGCARRSDFQCHADWLQARFNRGCYAVVRDYRLADQPDNLQRIPAGREPRRSVDIGFRDCDRNVHQPFLHACNRSVDVHLRQRLGWRDRHQEQRYNPRYPQGGTGF